jgi:hypothetical protein
MIVASTMISSAPVTGVANEEHAGHVGRGHLRDDHADACHGIGADPPAVTERRLI